MERGSNTRERMVAAAFELFGERGYGRLAERGYGNVTMLEVIERAGASRGSIYHYFPSGKEGLAIEVAGKVARDFEGVVDSIASSTVGPEAFLRGLLDYHRRLVTAYEFRVGCPLAGIRVNAERESERLRSAVSQAFSSWTAAIASGLASKGVPPASARRLASSVLAAIEGAIIVSRATDSTATFTYLSAAIPQLLADAGV